MTEQHEFYTKVDPNRYGKEKVYIHQHRNDLENCPYCNGSIKDRTITIYRGLIESLYKVYRWCGENGRHEFKMADIRDFLDHNDYARFSSLTRFGGIVYRPTNDTAKYGINMKRARDFYQGAYKIPIQIVIDQITNERVAATYISIHEVPDLYTMLTKEGMYDHEKLILVPIDYQKQLLADIPAVEDYKSILQ